MYLQQKDNGSISLIRWDWKEHPHWKHILDAIDRIKQRGYNPQIINIETGDDSEAVIIAPETFDRKKAQDIYEGDWDNFFGI